VNEEEKNDVSLFFAREKLAEENVIYSQELFKISINLELCHCARYEEIFNGLDQVDPDSSKMVVLKVKIMQECK
jgi:hypothetical protein